jgi:hypothetical protein
LPKQRAEHGAQVASGSGLNPAVWLVNVHNVQDTVNIDDIIEYTVITHLLEDGSGDGKDSAISPDAFLAHMLGCTATSGPPLGDI